MFISIRTLQGKVITVKVEPNDSIQSMKKQIQNKEGIRTDLQRLIYENKPLDNDRSLSSYGINEQSALQLIPRSAEQSNTVAGGFGQGSGVNELSFPYGLAIHDDQTIVITDWSNHRIVEWKVGDTKSTVVAGGHGQGNQLNQLNSPTDVLIDKKTDSLIICDRGNNRVVRWSRRDGTTEGEILLNNIACWGISMDAQGLLYVSDTEKHEVRRYKIGEKNAAVVAGGHGRGSGRNQLNEPTYIFVDQLQTVYVSDIWNHRVMKWNKDATEGIAVVQGFLRGLCVDQFETVYVADYGSRQVMRWPKGATQGTVVVDGHDTEADKYQVYHPWGLAFDQHGYIYVTDHSNHRIQRFRLEPAN